MLPATALRILAPVSVAAIVAIYKYFKSEGKRELPVATGVSLNPGGVSHLENDHPRRNFLASFLDQAPSDLDPATLDEIRKLDPAVLDVILKLPPAIVDRIRNFDPPALDEKSDPIGYQVQKLRLEENQDGEEAGGSCNGQGAETENGNENGCGGVEKKIVVEESSKKEKYAVRFKGGDCWMYLKTGICKSMSNCKFNHPPISKDKQMSKDKAKEGEELAEKPRQTESKVPKDRVKEGEELAENPGQTECKYYLRSGGCKYGKACRYSHRTGKASVAPVLDTNFAGLPIRPVSKDKAKEGEELAEKPCQKESKNDFKSEGKAQTLSHSGGKPSVALVQENFLGLPIRPGEINCSHYMRNLSCKYGTHCKFNHPDPIATGESNPPSRFRNGGRGLFQGASPSKVEPSSAPGSVNGTPLYVPPTNSVTDQTAVSSSCELSDKGLPLRPGQNICTEYSRYGTCKSGSSCKFDHPSSSIFSL